MSENNVLKIVHQVVELLTPLSSEERQRATNAAFALLGDVRKQKTLVIDEQEIAELKLQPKALRWVKENSIEMSMIEAYFHLDEVTSEVVDVPGSTGKDRSINGYLFTGGLALLTVGNGNFADQTARDFCKKDGSYNEKHHSEYMREARGLWVGSKENGWTLTAKGLKQLAVLINPVSK